MTHSVFPFMPVIVCGIIYFGLGALWYTPLFGKRWAKEVGMKGTGGPGKSFIWLMLGQLVSSVLFAFGIGIVTVLGDFHSLKGALIAAGIVSGFFIIPVNSGKGLFQGKPVLFLIDTGYNALGAFLIALILAFWH
jgi:hypothetical protein